MIKRSLLNNLEKSLVQEKALILYGPRRTGKTTLLRELCQSKQEPFKFVDGEDRSIQEILSSTRLQTLKEFLGKTTLLIIDEAQKIPNIGSNIKLIVDHLPHVKIIASGSASFSLAQKVGEPLTGRQITFRLYPLSLKELLDYAGIENRATLTENNLMIYGGYPETFKLDNDEKAQYLKELTQSTLLRDILEMENVRNPKKIQDLLILLAFQIGKEVSLSELGNHLDLHKDTVFRYLDLLEKSFVILNIRGFSRNLRKEVTKNSRYYFYDNGIRNALINNFNPLNLRDDVGDLWENFIVMERLKRQSYQQMNVNNYFWRTYDKQEIDWVEERNGKLYGYEFKWKKNKIKIPSAWKKTYPNAKYEIISQENYLDFI